MKALVACAAVLLLAALLAASNAGSQDPVLGETEPLTVACNDLIPIGLAGGLDVKNCRRAEPDELAGNRATVHVRIATDKGVFFIDVQLQKSIWHVGSWVQR